GAAPLSWPPPYRHLRTHVRIRGCARTIRRGANFTGGEYVEHRDTSIEALRGRFEAAVGPYRSALRRVIADDEWDTAPTRLRTHVLRSPDGRTKALVERHSGRYGPARPDHVGGRR